jgi:3-hydroxy-3-methylglutaryl CoA synthase
LIARTLDTKLRLVDKLEALGIVGPRPQPTEAELKAAEEKAAEAAAEGKPVRKERYKSRIPEYTPNFKSCIDHIAIHAGGRAVIDAIQKGLNLTDEDVLPSRATLKRYGNTSSSSIWYEFKYIEQNRQVKKGEQIWQLGFGSGFKCNSAVWKKL